MGRIIQVRDPADRQREINESSQNQHYVSQVLQRRFADDGFLERFDLKWNKWKRVATAQIFTRLAYSQLFAYGHHDNSLDESFQKCENALNETLNALDDATKQDTTELTEPACTNLFLYCAYLWRMSPFVKAIAPFEYALQLDLDLKNGKTDLLEEVGVKQEDIVTIRLLYAQGKKFIPAGENLLQVLFRIQFRRKCPELYQWLRYFCNWTIYSSPITMPIADMPFFSFNEHGVPLYIFTISPTHVLIGKTPSGTFQSHANTTLRTNVFTTSEAEYIRDAICLSALTAVASKDRSIDVLGARARAKEMGVRFPVIKSLESVFQAGQKEFTDLLRIVPVSEDVFREFKKSFFEMPT